jgi:hypothetical protein
VAELEALLSKGYGDLWSPVSYLAGTGLQLQLRASNYCRSANSIGYYISLHVDDYTLQGQQLVSAPVVLNLTYSVQRLAPGNAEALQLGEFNVALMSGSGWGVTSVLEVSSPHVPEGYLVDGCLKLRAHVKKIS